MVLCLVLYYIAPRYLALLCAQTSADEATRRRPSPSTYQEEGPTVLPMLTLPLNAGVTLWLREDGPMQEAEPICTFQTDRR